MQPHVMTFVIVFEGKRSQRCHASMSVSEVTDMLRRSGLPLRMCMVYGQGQVIEHLDQPGVPMECLVSALTDEARAMWEGLVPDTIITVKAPA